MTRAQTAPTGALVLMLSGAFGLLLGSIARTGQVAVESAQVVAGVVTYAEPTAFSIYHVKLWTAMIQLSALALRAGLSEYAVSSAWSVVIATLSCQAFALAVFAVSRSTWLAIASVPVIIVSGAFAYGAVYPILPYATAHTFGAVGLSTLILCLCLIGSGWIRAGLFLLGVLPALHPSLGFWTMVIALGALFGLRRDERQQLARGVSWYLLGLVLTGVSFAAYVVSLPALPQVAPDLASRYLNQFVDFWDTHRQPISPFVPGLAINLVMLATSAIYLRTRGDRLESFARFLLSVAIVAGALSVIVVAVTHLPARFVPAWLLIAMPSRVLNVNTFLFFPVVAALLWRERHLHWMLPALAAVWVGVMATEYRILERGSATDIREGWLDPFMVVVVAAILLLIALRKSSWPTIEAHARPSRISRFVVTAVTLYALSVVGVQSRSHARFSAIAMQDYSNDPFYAEIASRPGVLLESPKHRLLQLRTRRPVLLDPLAINQMPYALEGGPMMERVLRDVYDLDYFNPPPEAWRRGIVPIPRGRQVWEGYSRAQWRVLRQQFGVTDVVTPSDWVLNLPTVMLRGGSRLYSIPE